MKKVILASVVGVLLLMSANAGAKPSVVSQRGDSCVVMELKQAKVDGDSYEWSLDLKHPGTYVVQLIVETKKSKGTQSGTVSIDGKQLSNSLKKESVLEDGIVMEFDKPAVIAEAGMHVLTVQTPSAVAKVRLLPQLYPKSRIVISSSKYYDKWEKMHKSPEKQAAMDWFKNARFGMFIHWGVYSQAGGSWKGTRIEDSPIRGPRVAEWLMYTFNISRAEYKEFAKQFNPDKSFAKNIAKLAKDTGMKYVVITAKHHDGFALFDSKASDWDITDATPYDGDLIKELYDACRAEGLDFGVYYSHGHDWMDGCDADYANVKKYWDTLGVVTRPNGKNRWDPSPNSYKDYLEGKSYKQVAELIKLMPDLRLIWFDGEGLITEKQAFRFYKMIYDMNPNIVVNRRVGYDFGDYIDAGDNRTPGANELVTKHFETCGTGNHSWGYKAHDDRWKGTDQLLRYFADIVSKGGNYLLNIGPDGKGVVQKPCVEDFQEMGVWVKTNEDAVFGTTSWTKLSEGVGRIKGTSKPGEFWFSAKDDKVYVMSLVPAGETVVVKSLNKSAGKVTKVRLLGSSKKIKFEQTDDALAMNFTKIKTGANGFAVEVTLK